ncbi:MAG: hypothetical protein CFE62_006190 [Candidatus Aquirickettsiella gammari]|uniref:Uncharacterized protein n=1 Tax=Candidatus Aquirickettsiella gammari TaxID=2016198 RepID=A0A370CI62_9COXI|nr:MAG: hypothetical protein CFE62_006190 [Candidatus Aquirickettsiella gammari]
MRLKKTKALRYVVATFLTMGTVLSVGFLSFSGLWIIYPYVIPAVLAFFLAGIIEGKVYGTSIFKGLGRLKLLTANAQKHLFFIELNKFVSHKESQKESQNESWFNNQCNSLKDYWVKREKYKSLKKDLQADKNVLKDAKEALDQAKNSLYQQVRGNNISDEELNKLGKPLLKSAKHSAWFLRFFWIVSLSVGVVSGFATAFAVNEAITIGLALSLSATALSAIIWPVAIFAAIGATFLLYYIITDIVKNDTVEKAVSKVCELFKRKEDENKKEPLAAYVIRLIALSLVAVGITAITVFATAASAGTCWIIMRQGINLLLPKLPIFFAYCTSAILIPIGFTTDLIYGFSTTLLTINNCKGMFVAIFRVIQNPVEKFKSFIKTKLASVKDESWGQFFNPFRLIAKLVILPLQALVFIGHLISIGLTTDRFFSVPPSLVAIFCAISEGLQDLSFFTTEEDDHSHDDHDHGNLLQLPLQVILSPLLLIAGIHYWAFNKCASGNKLNFFEAITQSFGLPLLNVVFFPLLLPSAIWHWTFKKAGNNLTFYASVKKSFDVHSHADPSEASVSESELSSTTPQEQTLSNGYVNSSMAGVSENKKNNSCTFFSSSSTGSESSKSITAVNLQCAA